MVVNERFWFMHQHDPRRQGRVTDSNPLTQRSQVADESTFIVYPNPVEGDEVRARIVLNRDATVQIEIYNLEGEIATSQQHVVSGVVHTPFDEPIDVGRMKSGVYLLRLSIRSSCCSTSLVKSFAIVR